MALYYRSTQVLSPLRFNLNNLPQFKSVYLRPLSLSREGGNKGHQKSDHQNWGILSRRRLSRRSILGKRDIFGQNYRNKTLPEIEKISYRFENWNCFLAPFCPYFFRSTMRESRVKYPAAFNVARCDPSTSRSALAIP